MNKKILIYVIIAVLAMASSFATIYIDNDLKQAYYNQNNQLIQTGSITNVNAIGYVCSNEDCSQVAQQIFDKNVLSSSGSSLQTYFPNDALYMSDYGYGIYYYKDGYIPYEQRIIVDAPDYEDNYTSPDVQVVKLSQLETCRSVIDDFDVTNSVYPNQPVMVDISTNLNANAYSPIKNAGPNDYIPTQIKRQYQVQIEVTLDIIDDNGQVIDQQTQNIYVDFSGNKEVRFEYTPTDTGRYTARVSTSANDGKCMESESHMSQKDFSVINQGPIEMCYSLLQNLAVTPQYPIEDNPISINVDKLTNYYDEFGNLNPLATDLRLVVKKDGQIVHEENKDVSANDNILDYESVSFDYTPTQGGYYTVNVFADSVSCPFNVDEVDMVAQTIFVKGNTTTTPENPNKAPLWVAIPPLEMYEGNTDYVQTTNYVSDPDGDSLTISLVDQSNPQVASCTLSQNNKLLCTGNSDGSSVIQLLADDGEDSSLTSVTVTVLDPNRAPIMSELPDQLLPSGVRVNNDLFNLDDYTIDLDGDSLSYTIVTNTNDDFTCSIDSNNNLDCDVFTSEGFTDLTIVATDGELQDSDTVRISIDAAPVNQPPVANFNDVHLFKNSGLHVDIFDVRDYVSDPESDDLTIQFVSESRKDIVDCTIHDNRFDCNVKDNKVGVSVVTLSISDGVNQITDSFNVVVQDTPNNPPVIANIPDVELDENSGTNTAIIDLSNYASDVDGDSLTYTIFSETDRSIVDCSLSGSIVNCQVMPNQIGSSTIRVEVSDGQAIDTDSFVVSVEEVIEPNNPPVIANIPDIELDENSGTNTAILDLSNYASDVDGDSLSYRIFSESGRSIVDCSLSGSIVNCQVMPNRVGDSTVRIEVSDGQAIDTDSFVVSVEEVIEPNNPPVANFPNVELMVNSGFNADIFSFDNYASDADGDTLTYTITDQSNSQLVFCEDTNDELDCTVTPSMNGTSQVTVEVSDGVDTVSDTFVVTVRGDTNPNNPPVIANIPDVELDENSGTNTAILDLSNYASDVDGDSLSYRIFSESGRSIVDCSLSGSIVNCQVMPNRVGDSTVRIEVSDGQAIDTDSFVVSVEEVIEPNNPPTAQFPDVQLTANTDLNADIFAFDTYASDADGDTLSYTIIDQSNTGVVSCENNDGDLDCTVVPGMNGTSQVTVEVSDGIDSISDSFFVSVVGRADNSAPFITLDSLSVARNAQTSIDLDTVTTDPDGDAVTHSIYSQSNTDVVVCSIDVSELTCTAQTNRAGESIITMMVTDGYLATYKNVRVVVLDGDHVHTSTPRAEEYLSFAQVKHPSVIDVRDADIPINMVLRNGGDVDLTDVRVSIIIPELGTKQSFGPFDLDEGKFESRSIVLPIYYQPEPGYYMIRFSVTSDEGEDRIMYREVLFQ